VLVPLTNGTKLFVTDCNQAHQLDWFDQNAPNKTANVTKAQTDSAEVILRSAKIDEITRIAVRDAFRQSKNEDELASQLEKMNIPQKVKADLWEAKHSFSVGAANGSVRVRPGAHGGDCVYFSDPLFQQLGGRLSAIPLGDENQVAIEKDYWLGYAKVKSQDRSENMMMAAVLSLWGFPLGIIVWLFYRLVRFAVKG
jgi:hypothetical protein